MNEKKCREEDRERLLELFDEVAGHIGHQAIRELYHLNRKIRNEMHISVFPIALFYRSSLFNKLNSEYSQMSTVEIAKTEGLDTRRMYNIRKNYWKYKKYYKLKD